MSSPLTAGLRRGLAVAATLLLALLVALSGGPSVTPEADAGCKIRVSSLEPVSKYPFPFASQYTSKMRVAVFNSTGGVYDWRVELYDYAGNRMGKSKVRKQWLYWGDTATIHLKQPMQPNGFTLILKGEVHNCGFSEDKDTVKLMDCRDDLPITATETPTGLAADYNAGGYVSVEIKPESGWTPIRDVHSTLRNAAGEKFGEAELPKGYRNLIGEKSLDHELTRTLTPGEYEVDVRARAPQPKSCGKVSASIPLEFTAEGEEEPEAPQP
jgi:hypothetical protein